MTQMEWEEKMSEKLLRATQNELYLEMHFFHIALSKLSYQRREDIATFATDGKYLYYAAEPLFRAYKKNPVFLNRLYLHSVLHCLFSHLWLRGSREKDKWSLACDIVVEYIIDSMEKRCVKRPISFLRTQVYSQCMEGKARSAANVYQWILQKTKEEQEKLRYEFYTDNHSFWPKEEKPSIQQQQLADSWNKVQRQSSMEMEKSGKDESKGKQLLQQELDVKQSRRSYRDFLRRFAVLREEMHCDPDEFDLGYYTFGLRTYKNMPLIEPLESREVLKIQEFAIVIDTSYSTSKDLVKSFLEETFRILCERDCFFHKSKIRLLQCDDKVQTDEEIVGWDQLDGLIRRFTVVGGGGTDFRPAFSYIEDLRKQGQLKNLKGLLYFTDGKGIYPKKRPDYPVAFCFVEDYEEKQVPPWAMQVKVDVEEMK